MSVKSSQQNDSTPWFADGLRFSCEQGCVECCVTHGDHAYVYLENGEDRRLAEHLSISLAWFRKRYTFLEDGYRALRMDEPACIFLNANGCSVYEARPTQCRTFPFWREHLASPSSWKALRRFCPGIDQGELHSQRRIEILAEERELGIVIGEDE